MNLSNVRNRLADRFDAAFFVSPKPDHLVVDPYGSRTLMPQVVRAVRSLGYTAEQVVQLPSGKTVLKLTTIR